MFFPLYIYICQSSKFIQISDFQRVRNAGMVLSWERPKVWFQWGLSGYERRPMHFVHRWLVWWLLVPCGAAVLSSWLEHVATIPMFVAPHGSMGQNSLPPAPRAEHGQIGGFLYGSYLVFPRILSLIPQALRIPSACVQPGEGGERLLRWQGPRLVAGFRSVSQVHPCHMGMDQYLLIQFLVGWTSIYQLFWCSPGVQGFDTLPHVHPRKFFWSPEPLAIFPPVQFVKLHRRLGTSSSALIWSGTPGINGHERDKFS